ncbi:unnamed protein product [Owenia fusiformis]|uniref:Protein NDNF n=1 Tax=Owenia fusiformis TaxID=6347 RepID=A0A8J1UAU8_OWEFU|nr:unnamed protein product [Owenia fusiformis]
MQKEDKTKMRSLHIFIVLNFLLMIFIETESQKLPTRDESQFHYQMQQKEVFHDSMLLPDGAEIRAYLLDLVARRYYFLVEEDATPLMITLTPCGSAVEWRVSVHEAPVQHSGDGSFPEDDPLLEQEEHITPNDIDGVTLQYFNAKYGAQTYLNDQSPAGIYVIEARSNGGDCGVVIYATTTPYSDQPYPPLPRDPHVHILASSATTVTITWKKSHAMSEPSDVEYCVSVNKKRALQTMCSAQALHRSDHSKNRLTTGFDIVRNAPHMLDREMDNNRPVSFNPHKDRKSVSNKSSIQCIGKKTTYTHGGLLPGRTYFFDVFVISKSTNRSSAYIGTSIRTKRPNMISKTITDGVVENGMLTTISKGKMYKFTVNKDAKTLFLSIQPCSGKVHVHLSHEGRTMMSMKAKNFRSVHFPIDPRSKDEKDAVFKLRITNTGSRRQYAHYRLFMSTKPENNPFPSLPNDTTIKVLTKSRDCKTVTLVWPGTRERQKYCLYKRSIALSNYTTENIDKLSLFPKQNAAQQCGFTTNDAIVDEVNDRNLWSNKEKILCRNFRYKEQRNTVMKATVRNLKPDSIYVFEVVVTKTLGVSLPYEQLWMRTPKNCK